MKKVYFVILLLCLVCASAVMAQSDTISVPYIMSFEESDSAELHNWVLNPGVQASFCKEEWIVGGACASDGQCAMYISADGGQTEYFTQTTNVQYAYRDVLLPKGTYVITFDWRCMGAAGSYLSVGAGPASQLKLEANSNSSSIIKNVSTWLNQGGLKQMKGTTQWQNASITTSSNGSRVMRIFFVWQSNNNDSVVSPVAACIDNVQITSAACKQPSEVKASAQNDTVTVYWKGSSEKYEVEYKRRGSQRWYKQTNLYQSENEINTVQIEGMDEGAYDIRVRGVCDSLYSAYRYLNSFVVFYPDRHCINYVNLQDSVNVICTYGTYKDPYQAIGVLDDGSSSISSRHTVNWEQDVYDPRTGNQLPLIPEGALASVRIGNWDNGSEGESISYLYTVDAATAAILLVRYAVVLEDPGHNEQPEFNLEILDEGGELIDATCGAATFTFDDAVEAGWKMYNKFAWKNWTTLGLNLEEYDGQTITIRLSTKDCNWGAHCGYAYFTLDCAAARITGTSCGSAAQMSIAAPEGFNYVWYNYKDSIVSNEKQLSILPSDTTTYRCHLSYLEDSTCGFDLYSNAYPRFPVSDFTWTYQPSNCRNTVRFSNKSHIYTEFDGNAEHHYDQECDAYEWSIAGTGLKEAIESTDKNPVLHFPTTGGTYYATLIASIAEGECMNDTTITFTLPAIGDTEEFIDSTICEGSWIVFDKYVAAESGEYRAENKSVAGCDSIVTLRLKTNPQSSLFLGDTTVCAEEPLCIDGECYKLPSSGQWVRFLKNQYGCDSTLVMNVTKFDSILPTVSVTDVEGAFNSGEITLGGSGYDYYMINGEKNGALTGLNGGTFVLEFFNDFGCSVDAEVTMDYPCMNITIDSVEFVAEPDSLWYIHFDMDTNSIASTYSLIFDADGHAHGLNDIRDAPLPGNDTKITITIPSGVRPNDYNAQLIIRDPLCGDQTFDLLMKMVFSCLQVQLAEVPFVCQDDIEYVIPFVVDSGITTVYSILFDSVALAQGFVNLVNVSMVDINAFTIPVPTAAAAGVYHAQLVLRDVLCEDVLIDLELPLHYSSEIILQRWDDVIAVRNTNPKDGSSLAGEFVNFQWYKNGEEIADATKSYYYAEEGLDMTATYQVELTLADGTVLSHCAYMPKVETMQQVSVQPTQTQMGQSVVVTSPVAGMVSCYSSTGLLMSTMAISAGENTMSVPSLQGVYILHVKTSNGVETFRVTVK